MNLDHYRGTSTLASAGMPFRAVAEMVLAGRYPDFRPCDGAVPTAPGCPPGDVARAQPLPPADDLSSCARSLASVIHTRRSGGLRAGPVSSSALAALLVAGNRVPEMLPDSTFAPAIYPVVFDVDGVAPGAYRYAGDDHALVPIREVDRRVFTETALLQHEHGTGGALLFVVVPLSRWLEAFGDRGYRGAALSSGWLTDRLYLVAETLGLTYTATGGFAPAIVDELLRLDGAERTALFAFAVGGTRRFAVHEGSGI